ncbi:MAG: fumarylacetoacetate hydrolase family protein [Rhodospirillaceae bacterium]|nr:fumarylacetoacetate hydrolase family protein [Rhodospirillaceae bacterium]
MRNTVIAALIAAMPALGLTQNAVPFKLGTFEDGGATWLGLVLDDSLVVNIAEANASLDGDRPDIPSEMTALIVAYDEVAPRLRAIAASAAADPDAAYISNRSDVRVRPPIRPHIIYNAASNYALHAAEMAGRPGEIIEGPTPDPIPGIWERTPDDRRQNPYIFLKMANTIIADGESIRMPPARPNLDWECELAVVIGRSASRVAVEDAEDYIFGYTLENDVSDRGGRGDGRMGTDWFLQKNHDTFAPLGPFIVPKEFVPEPLSLRQTLTLSGTVMQDSNTGNMTHDIYDLLSYVSHIATMQPGDIYAMGSPSGVGTARETPIYMKPGDTAVCEIESIGTLTNPVVGPDSE